MAYLFFVVIYANSAMVFYESAYGMIVVNEVGSSPISVGRRLQMCCNMYKHYLKPISWPAYLVAMVWVYPSDGVLAAMQP